MQYDIPFVSVHVCGDVLVCAHTCGGQRLRLCLLLSLSKFFLRQGLVLNPEHSVLARLAIPGVPTVCPTAGRIDVLATLDFLTGLSVQTWFLMFA